MDWKLTMRAPKVFPTLIVAVVDLDPTCFLLRSN